MNKNVPRHILPITILDKQAINTKCIILLSMIYICILFCSAVLSSKLILTPFGPISAGSLTGPFWFILSDIIAEVYGYEISKNIFWASMICELIFIFICKIMLSMSSPIGWHGQVAYEFVFGHLIVIYASQFIAIIIAWYLNVKLLTKWKILLQGRYFWMRSIGASGIGEILYSGIAVTLNMLPRMGMLGLTYSTLSHMVILSAIIKIIFSIIFSYPATLVVLILRRYEN